MILATTQKDMITWYSREDLPNDMWSPVIGATMVKFRPLLTVTGHFKNACISGLGANSQFRLRPFGWLKRGSDLEINIHRLGLGPEYLFFDYRRRRCRSQVAVVIIVAVANGYRRSRCALLTALAQTQAHWHAPARATERPSNASERCFSTALKAI